MPRWNTDYMHLCGYIPFRHTTYDRSEDQPVRSTLEERVRRWYTPNHRHTDAAPFQVRISDFGHCHPTAESFIRALLNPDFVCHPTADQALMHAWLTSFATPTEHDLSNPRENFDPRARWRSAINTARALSCFANH
jgi:hypothetical protein